MLQQLYPFGIALLVGLFIGIERERSHPAGSQAMGVRTFVLISLLGALAASTANPYLIFSASLFAFLIILLSYLHIGKLKAKQRVIGITTEVSAAVVFFLGYLSHSKPLISALVAITVLAALLTRSGLRSFSRNTLKTKEIYAAIIILAIGLGLMPLLPNHGIDPWQVFNPRRYVLLILVLSIVQFAGYVTIRLFGSRLGILLNAFFSGLVSSTAVFLFLAKLSTQQKETNTNTLVVSGLLATNAMLIETLIIFFIVSKTLLTLLFLPIMSMLAVGFVSVWPVLRNKKPGYTALTPPNPLDLKNIIKLASFIIGMLGLITLIKQHIGTHAVQLVSFLGGLFEIHSVNIANASLFTQLQLTLHQTIQSIALALLASFITKFFILWRLSDRKFALHSTAYLIIMMMVGFGSYWLVSL